MANHRRTPALALLAATAATALTLTGVTAAAASPRSDDHQPPGHTTPAVVHTADIHATRETRSLSAYLDSTLGSGALFGQQNTTTNGITFTGHGDGTQSDVRAAVGDYPAVFGFEGGDYFGYDKPAPPTNDEITRFVGDIQNAHRLGGIVTVSAHMPNFATGKGYYDTTGRTVGHVLPGGDKNADFLRYLDGLAQVFAGAKDDHGRPIPIIFRPFHENTGNWFWWGTSNATTGEFKELFRYTVEHLRDADNLHNLLYAFSPNASFGGDSSRYLATYPGDQWVDVLGYDAYDYNNAPDDSSAYIASTVADLSMLSTIAEEHGKIPALTEFGRNGDRTLKPSGNKSVRWFTDVIHGIEANAGARRIAYMMTWVNWGLDQFYTPYPAFGTTPAHEMLNDFQAFYADPYTVFRNDLAPTRYDIRTTVAPQAPSIHIVTPADGVRITEPTVTIRVKAGAERPKTVTAAVATTTTPLVLRPAQDGYWEAKWNIGAENLTNASSTLTVTATYPKGDTRTATSGVVLGAPPTFANGVVDDFEGYGDNAALQAAYSYNNTQPSDLSLDPGTASHGKNGIRFAYDFTTRDYGGFGKNFASTEDWSGFTAVHLHLVPDGSNQKFVLQFSTADGHTFEAYPSLAGTTPESLDVPLSQFQDKAGARPAPTVSQLQGVTQFWVYLNSVGAPRSGSIGLDDIHAE